MKKKIWYFQTRLILIQIFLVVPMLALLLFISIYWIRDSAVTAINESRNNSLQTAADAFDQVYRRMINLLEKPYTDTSLYNIITSESNEINRTNRNMNNQVVGHLLNNIIYYEPDISSITLVLDKTSSIYYKRRLPSVAVNVHNPDWYHLKKSTWYQDAISIDSYHVTPVTVDELYLNSGPTIAISQRLLNTISNEKIGVFRIDLSIQSFYNSWLSIVQNPNKDMLLVLDAYNQLMFCSSTDYIESHPIASFINTEDLDSSPYQNNSTASTSGVQFIYLSKSNALFDLKHPLYLIGISLLIFYIIYAFIFIRWSSHYISSPINKLKRAMIQGQAHDLSARCEPLAGEMESLSDAFNELMERMDLLIEEATSHEQEKAQLAYEILQSKINPHFLYNTLNAIRCKADMIGAVNISHALESLASLLRFTIKCTDETIPFDVELAQLENYIQIMRIRYGDEIEFDFDIDEECLQYQSLKFLIQPMIENCFIHAFQYDKHQQNYVAVQITCKKSSILVSVKDNGNGMTIEQINQVLSSHPMESKTKYFGIGINNVNQRIQALFGTPYSLWIESEPDVYTKVCASIPKIPLQETVKSYSDKNGD